MSKYKNLGDMLATLMVELQEAVAGDHMKILAALTTCHEVCNGPGKRSIVTTKVVADMQEALRSERP
jgi:hypothetical protein